MKKFQVLVGLSLVALFGLSTRAKALEHPEYRYVCDAQDSSMTALLTVDAVGKYVIYEDPGNNCNGHGSRFAHSEFYIFETDCEWKEGFVNFILESGMIEGESGGVMIAQIAGVPRPTHRYFCKRVQ